MALSGDKDSLTPNGLNGAVPGTIERNEREHSNPEEIAALYEELFENENNERPCYLPDSGQEDSKSVLHDYSDEAEEDGKVRRDSLGETGEELKPVSGKSSLITLARQKSSESKDSRVKDSSEDLDARSTGGEEVNIPENDEFRADAESSSPAHSADLDRELSSDRGLDGSPSSSSSEGGTSGYMAGSGSSSASTSSVSGTEAATDQDTEGIGRKKDASRAWVPGKRHHDEDDTHPSWRRHKKHFFILSNAGKPVYSRYGDEHKLAGFSATLQAIMSFVENSGDLIHLVRAGDHQIIFLVRGPLYLVCITSTKFSRSSTLRSSQKPGGAVAWTGITDFDEGS